MVINVIGFWYLLPDKSGSSRHESELDRRALIEIAHLDRRFSHLLPLYVPSWCDGCHLVRGLIDRQTRDIAPAAIGESGAHADLDVVDGLQHHSFRGRDFDSLQNRRGRRIGARTFVNPTPQDSILCRILAEAFASLMRDGAYRFQEEQAFRRLQGICTAS